MSSRKPSWPELYHTLELIKSKELGIELPLKLFAKWVVDLDTDCWYRQDNINTYTRIDDILSHRLSYWLFRGIKPEDDLMICHSCDHPGCFNPYHLFEGTAQDNIQDAVRKGRMTGLNFLKRNKPVEKLLPSERKQKVVDILAKQEKKQARIRMLERVIQEARAGKPIVSKINQTPEERIKLLGFDDTLPEGIW